MYSMKEFCKKVGLHRTTILKLEKMGIIEPLRTPGGERRFTDEHVRQVYAYYGNKNIAKKEKRVVIYARVSTQHQKDFLKNQIETCKQFALTRGMTVTDVITDVASSFNFNRKGLKQLLDLVFSYEVSHVIIFDIDRLSRIAYNLFESIFKRYGTEIIVVDRTLDTPDKIDEITQELVSFIHYTTSKIYGKRRYKSKLQELVETQPVEMNHDKEDTNN